MWYRFVGNVIERRACCCVMAVTKGEQKKPGLLHGCLCPTYMQVLDTTCRYHLDCLTPPLEEVPEGNWYCEHCERIVCGADHDDVQPLSSPERRLRILLTSSESEEEGTTEEEMSDETAATSSSHGSKGEGILGEAATSSSSQETKTERSASSRSGFLSDSSSSPSGRKRWRAGHSLRTRDVWRPIVVVSTSSDEVDIDAVNEPSEDILLPLHSNARVNNQGRQTDGCLPHTRSPDRSESSVIATKSSRTCHGSPSVPPCSGTSNSTSTRSRQSASTSQQRRKVTHGKDGKKRRNKRRRRHRRRRTKKEWSARRKRQKATKKAKFLRARTVATHRTTMSRVDQSIRQAVIASHRFDKCQLAILL